MAEAELSNGAFQSFEDGTLFSVVPPPIEGLGTSGGFALRLQDRGGLGREACWPPMSNSWPKCLRTRCSLTSWSKA